MGLIRKLASQTAVYGLSSMLGRFINFLLVIPHTEYLKTVGDFGDITTIFAFMAFLNILLTYGMETTYFNFIRNGRDPDTVFSVAQKSLIVSTLVFAVFIWLFAPQSAAFMGFPENPEYVYCCLIFLVFDTLSALPFARIRYEEKPLKFALIKLINIAVNVTLNIYLLTNTPDFLKAYSQVTLILVATAVASLSSFLFLTPLAFRLTAAFDKALFRQMLSYAWPLIFVGLAGIVNETLDRTLLKRMLPAAEGSYQNGIYGAFYKLTMVMTMFVQAFRFAAEPLFFKQKESADNRAAYAHVMYWFIGVCSLIFLACMFFLDELAHLFIRNNDFFENPDGMRIVPVLLLANMFLGIYYNLSIWYRFTGNTKLGASIAIGGALLTIVLNLLFIPQFGFVACAWITLWVYAAMCIASFLMGARYYPVPYHILRYGLLIAASVGIWLGGSMLVRHISVIWLQITINVLMLALMVLIIWMLQPKRKNA